MSELQEADVSHMYLTQYVFINEALWHYRDATGFKSSCPDVRGRACLVYHHFYVFQ